MPATGQLLRTEELNHPLCFVTPKPARAWDGAAPRANGLVGGSAFQDGKLLGTQQASQVPRCGSRALEGTRLRHQFASAGARPGAGTCGFLVGLRSSGCQAPWRWPAVAAALRGTARSPAPASPPPGGAGTESYCVLTWQQQARAGAARS